jgi:uncharacterized membrane protein
MPDRRDGGGGRLVRALGWTSLGLGVPMVAAHRAVARAAGVDDSATAVGLVRAAGVRELGQGLALLVGPRSMVWARVAGDAIDVSLLALATARRGGRRRRRTALAAGAVAALTAVDLFAAIRAGRRRQHGPGRPGPLKLEASTTVNRSPDDTYAYWRNLENLPSFMLHLQSVTEDGNGRSHWVANAPLKGSVEWDAEMTGNDPGRRISWRSLPGSDIDNSGTVHFAPAPDGRGTEVRIVLHYDVPGGRIGRTVAKVLGEEPRQQVRDDLRRFKQVLETGEVLRSDAFPHGVDARRRLRQRPARPKYAHRDTARR